MPRPGRERPPFPAGGSRPPPRSPPRRRPVATGGPESRYRRPESLWVGELSIISKYWGGGETGSVRRFWVGGPAAGPADAVAVGRHFRYPRRSSGMAPGSRVRKVKGRSHQTARAIATTASAPPITRPSAMPQFHFDFFHAVRKRIEPESARLQQRPQAGHRPQAHAAGVIVKHRPCSGGLRCFGNFSHKRKLMAKKPLNPRSGRAG